MDDWRYNLESLILIYGVDVVAAQIGVCARTVYRWRSGDSEPTRPSKQLIIIFAEKERGNE